MASCFIKTRAETNLRFCRTVAEAATEPCGGVMLSSRYKMQLHLQTLAALMEANIFVQKFKIVLFIKFLKTDLEARVGDVLSMTLRKTSQDVLSFVKLGIQKRMSSLLNNME
ncbi:hypothetical protein BpHYR1_049575 [Brachionus plicatilis]|uniref:Uncharacterized protein n=1 Tax=Brachionus plicatilis TaxID=10195 RepID=A0A3M7P479_BRAPC|nr:hypothetical protein BpHYR1_049575 [Brachionus plicatilis]